MRLGVVYTPVQIVDFILRSADDVLRQHFGHGLTGQDVHILDGFTGTGTFIVRLLQLGLIEPHHLARKYASELHANEILLLAYYIAAINIESTYHDLTRANGDQGGTDYQPFPGLVLTDTFQSYEEGDTDALEVFPATSARIARQRGLPITVIVGNPPYSSGQDSANDDAANQAYPHLDASIRDSYAARSTATNKNSLYDSYIRAIRWASLRIEGRGVVAYVTNGGWLDSNTADGMRLTLADEFSDIHVYNLRGNARTSGEQRQKEGGTVFDSGSRATVAITVLVKDPTRAGPATIYYTDIGDYLTRDDKLAAVADTGSVTGLPSQRISPNPHGDWLNQRSDDFDTFLPLGDKEGGAAVFALYSGGLKTNRDAWCYNSSCETVETSMARLVSTYEADRLAGRTAETATRGGRQISWNRSLLADLDKGRPRAFDSGRIQTGAYRPFTRQHVYFDRVLNDMVYRLQDLFPTPKHDNTGFVVMAPRVEARPSILMVDRLPDLSFYTYTGQFFARWRYEKVEEDGLLPLDSDKGEFVDGYRKIDNITDEALARFQVAYGEQVTTDDVFFYCYGLLHSSHYRQTYAADLKKALP
ncbi:MAG: type ISP restriction/modification enzyme, partial [Jiangellales bacterium]